jgi:cytochrome bd ubiquinol oxidase subunit II
MQDIIQFANQNPQWLPYTFAFLLALSLLIYAVLDGYDLGIGILSKATNNSIEQDKMVDSIGPFWDANETWLVLAIGILLVAFPQANGIILTSLYLPILAMIIGIIFRGVSIEYRKKVKPEHKNFWNNCFFGGSVLMAFSQGYMIGSYILGFDNSLSTIAFSSLAGICLIAGYALMGACWLIIRTEGNLQNKAITWAKKSLIGSIVGIALVSITTPLVSADVFNKWFTLPNGLFLAILPVCTALLIALMLKILNSGKLEQHKILWAPIGIAAGIFTLSFIALAYSFFPYIVPNKLTIVESASSYEALLVIFAGAVVVLPILFAYTFLVYRIFKGKTIDLSYD